MSNVLVIVSDEHHPRMCGYRNHPLIKTPNLDRLAREGTHFTRAYCNSPVCTPSRMSFMTGEYVHHSEVWTNGVPFGGDNTTWAQRASEAGITNVSRGKMDVSGPFQDMRFDDFDEPIGRGTWKWPREEPLPQKVPGFRSPVGCYPMPLS